MAPRGLNRGAVQQLLANIKHHRSVASRIAAFSKHFIGSPYTPFPLIGSADTPEVLVASLDGFDCVTYIETVLALARASSVDSFITWLRKIRYDHGRIDWKKRNHYMTGWIRNNLRDGTLDRIRISSVPTVQRKRVLNVVPGLPARSTTVNCVPKSAISRLAEQLSTGDLIFFASTRKTLDFFHAGIVVRNGDRLLVRHASRSQGGVVEQQLADFLEANRMAGVVVVRPSE
jgi:hypothetical protein